MSKNSYTLIGVALALALLYIVFFSDWLKPKVIQISSRISPASGSLVFYLDKPYSLTSVEVVGEDDAKTNPHPHALWHLVHSNTAKPTSTFTYGAKLKGMQPEVATALPEPLEPDVSYLLILKAAGWKGQTNFSIH